MATNTTGLEDTATVIAMRAARAWLDKHPEARLDDYPAFCECLKANLAIRLPEALTDAKAALDANMGQVAEQTFALSIMQAGIDAAKEACTLSV